MIRSLLNSLLYFPSREFIQTPEQAGLLYRDLARLHYPFMPASLVPDAYPADIDLLVLGSRAYGPVRRPLLGSVSSAVVRHASCPVLVTPRVGESLG